MLVKTTFFFFVLFSCQKKQFFRIVETYFSTKLHSGLWKRIFWLVQTIFYIFSETPAGESFLFSVYWKGVFERIGRSGYWRRIFLFNIDHYFTWNFFSTSGNRHCYEWKAIFKDRTYFYWWKLIFWLVETIFFNCLMYFSRSPLSQLAETHFLVQNNSIVFYSELSFLLVKAIIWIIEKPIKTFITAIGNHFL